MIEPRSLFLELDRQRFHYLDFGGEGLTPLVFVHGTGFHAALWLHYGRALRDRFHVYALDQRGHGDSTKSAPDYNWTSFGDDLAAFVSALSLSSPLCVGHSMGGTVIVFAEARHPGTIGRAVLIDPIIMGDAYYAGDFTMENEPRAAGALRRRNVWQSRRAMLDSYRDRPPFVSWRADHLEDYVNHGTEMMADGRFRLKCPPEIEALTYLGGHHTDPRPCLSSVDVPTLIMGVDSGHTAGITEPEQTVAAMAQAELIMFSGATHFLPMEDPQSVIDHIVDFNARAPSLKADPPTSGP